MRFAVGNQGIFYQTCAQLCGNVYKIGKNLWINLCIQKVIHRLCDK